jgi:fengycin family lipopeptide synthetase D
VKEYAAWHNKLLSHKNSVQLKKYWHNKLKGKLPKLNLPVDYPDGFADIGRYAIYRIYLDADFQRQLNDFTLKSGTSLFALMLASLNVLLYKLTGQKDIIVTTPVATREHEELNDVVGFFVNSLLIRSGINEKMPFAEFMAETSRDFVEAMSNQAYPVEKVFDELNFSTSDYTPVLLNTHNYPGQTLPTLTNTESRHDASDLRSRVYIGLVFDEYKNGIEINWLYRVNLFKPGTIEQISSSFMHLIEKVLEEPDIEIREINTVLEELI